MVGQTCHARSVGQRHDVEQAMTKATQTPPAPDTAESALRMRSQRDRPAGMPDRLAERVAEKLPERVPDGVPERSPGRAPERVVPPGGHAAPPSAVQQHRAVAEQVVQALQAQADAAEQQALKERQDAIFFDGQWYLNAYPDIRASGMEPVEHFLHYGVQEKRNPNAIFNSQAYLRANPDVATFVAGPFLHYVCFGFREKRPLR